MTPTLREAAEAVLSWAREMAFASDEGRLDALEAVLKGEPEAPKVERELVAYGVYPRWDGENWVIFIRGGDQQDARPFVAPFGDEPFSLYAERPIPTKSKREELAEWLEPAANDWTDPQIVPSRKVLSARLREAAAELRKKETAS